MRKPRVLPLAIALTATAVLLFGGFALYKQLAVAAPLAEKLEAMPGVMEASKPEIRPKDMNVKLRLAPDASLRETYGKAAKEAVEAAGNRKVAIQVESDANDKLEQLWYGAMFEVAEAMETKSYSDIPEAMDRMAEKAEGITAVTEMDETNVYITIRSEQEEAAKYIVLPRIANQLEVW